MRISVYGVYTLTIDLHKMFMNNKRDQINRLKLSQPKLSLEVESLTRNLLNLSHGGTIHESRNTPVNYKNFVIA